MDAQAEIELKKKRANVSIREMEIDDLATVFHLGEKLFTAKEVPNLYRTWDEYEVISLFQTDSEFCLVAESEEGQLVGFALGTTVTKSHSAWKYGYLVWMGIDPEFHGLGVASKLFNRFRDIMLENGVRMLLVDSEADNLPALHFFSEDGVRPSAGAHLPGAQYRPATEAAQGKENLLPRPQPLQNGRRRLT